MRPVPPASLVERLQRLHLATPAQVASAAARVRRLAGELLEFESVWIDALAQSKVITPWQASEFNAGRGDQLVCGSYVLTGRLGDPGFAECYLARHIESTDIARLYVCHRPQRPVGETLVELRALAARELPAELPAVLDCGTNGKSVWGVCRVVEGTSAHAWLAENGRMPPAAVLQIARAMVEQLAMLERQGLVHGDLCPAGMLIDGTGAVTLPAPGLRGIIRPQEGIGFAELRPEAYDYLAPERVAGGTPPDVASDLYACGTVWWHLLAGRPPVAGGNSRAKLHAVQAARVIDIRSIAQNVPAKLAEVMARCLATERTKRPASVAEVAELLGPATAAGRELLASLQRSPTGTWQNLRLATPRRVRRKSQRPLTIGAACALLIMLLAAMPVLLRNRQAEPATNESLVVAASVPVPRPPAPSSHKSEVPKVDPAVRPAAATSPLEKPVDLQRVVEDLVLPTGEVLKIETLELEPRMRVRGRGGRRPLVSVPAQGLLVACENVTFEGIDFIWQAPAGDNAAASDCAVIRLQAQTINFRGCSFSSRTSAPPTAIRTSPARRQLGGFGVEISLADCVFDGVGSVVDHNSPEPIAARLENCLCVASGPILRLARCPTEDNEILLLLEHVTTRGDTSVLLIQNARTLGNPGPIAITASGCALAGTSRAGLISLVGAPSPAAQIGTIAWNGQGSVMSPRMPLLTSQGPSGGIAPLADDALAVAGLVRGELEFAGRADGPPADSRVMRWQVPLRSAEPPGADPDRLHSLRSKRDE